MLRRQVLIRCTTVEAFQHPFETLTFELEATAKKNHSKFTRGSDTWGILHELVANGIRQGQRPLLRTHHVDVDIFQNRDDVSASGVDNPFCAACKLHRSFFHDQVRY